MKKSYQIPQCEIICIEPSNNILGDEESGQAVVSTNEDKLFEGNEVITDDDPKTSSSLWD